MNPLTPRELPRATCLLVLFLAPLLWLLPGIVGERTFVPWDLAAWPPVATTLTQEQVAAAQDGANLDVTEVPIWFLPEWRFVRHWLIEHGTLATWNPHARGGASILGHGLIGLFYPPNWLLLLDDHPERRLAWVAWLNLLIAGLGAFGLLRAHALSRGAALVGALTFQLAAPLAANAHFWMRLAALVWLPALLWAQAAIAARPTTRRWWPMLAGAIAFAMPWLAGFPPYATATAVLAMLHGAMLTAATWHRDGAPTALRVARDLTFAAIAGVGLAAPQLLPSVAWFGQAFRNAHPDLATIAGAKFDAFGLLGYALPEVFGHPTRPQMPYGQSPLALLWCSLTDRYGKPVPTNYNFTEYSVYAGALALPLLVLGAVRPLGPRRWWPLLAFLLLLAMATFAPGARALFALPVLENVWPMRWLAPGALFVAWLCAMGVERMLADPRARTAGALVAGVLAIAAAAAWLLVPGTYSTAAVVDGLARHYGLEATAVAAHVQNGAPAGVDRFALATDWLRTGLGQCATLLALGAFALTALRRRSATALVAALVAVQLVDLGTHGASLLRGARCEHATTTAVHEFLRAEGAANQERGGFAIARASRSPTLPVQLPPGGLLVPGIRDLHFDSHYDGRSHEPLLRLFDRITDHGPDLGQRLAGKSYLTTTLPDHPVLQHPLLDLYGIRWLLAVEPLQHAGPRGGPELRGPGGEFFLYERSTALPRAFVVDTLRVLPDDEAVLAAMIDPTFAPARTALMTQADAPAVRPAVSPEARGRTVRFAADTPTSLELDVGDGPAGWLVLTDNFVPGWSATIGGAATALLRGNHCQRVLGLPAGGCTVRFEYHAPGLRTGLLAAALTLAAFVALALRTRWRRHEPPATAS
ncbi:MAG: hypothetical protein IPK26_28885 [Planctomycetes bacterium]|nr:hypothetical protein [Planctomycetota bacterium]